MANTFKVKTHTAMPDTAGTPLTLYTVPSNTRAVVLGLMLCNIDSSQRTVDVQIVSDTSDTETNETVFAIKDAPVPAGSTLEVMGGNKVVLQTNDTLTAESDVNSSLDVALTIMEIT